MAIFYKGKCVGNVIMCESTKAIQDMLNAYEPSGVLNVPEGVEKIHTYMFRTLKTLTGVIFPSTLKTIGSYAFYDCDGITEIEFPKAIETIENSAFGYIGDLKKVTFKGTPTTIETCFTGCHELRTINAPWSEGEVAGAPWGAANATINYDYIASEE